MNENINQKSVSNGIDACSLQPGVSAVVKTTRFRCLAVLQPDGTWKEAYGNGNTLEDVISVDSVLGP
jgi:hypothetical protein